ASRCCCGQAISSFISCDTWAKPAERLALYLTDCSVKGAEALRFMAGPRNRRITVVNSERDSQVGIDSAPAWVQGSSCSSDGETDVCTRETWVIKFGSRLGGAESDTGGWGALMKILHDSPPFSLHFGAQSYSPHCSHLFTCC
ncbi:hypothetical protein ANANG_G00268490, partial [Anguilla anguilla]